MESEGLLGHDGKAYAAPCSLEKDDLRGLMSRRESVGVGGGAKKGLETVDSKDPELPLQQKVTCAGSVLAMGAAALGSDMACRRD